MSDVNVWGDIKFGAVWKARTSFSHALVDEHVFSTWNYGRVVCVGDSVVKVRSLPIVKDDLQAYKLMLWQL
jgi:FAD dependent monooxygenase